MSLSQARDSAPPGVVDTLTAGFTTINRIIWVLALPILLDVFLWLGPRLSIEPVGQQILDWYGRQTAVAAAAGSPMVITSEQLRQSVAGPMASFNLFSVIALNVAGLPSFMANQSIDRPAAAEIHDLVILLLLVIGLALGGLLPGAAFLTLIGQVVRGQSISLENHQIYSRIVRVWLYLVAFVVGAFILALVIALPVSAILSIILMISQAFGAIMILLAGALLQVAFFASIIYLFFLVDAIVISEVHPLRAGWNSILVVARSFWPSLGFIMLSFIILTGTQIIWSRMVSPQLGPLPCIVANAYIASGLTAASMLFYQNRLALLGRKP
jgi:hypothetical protein